MQESQETVILENMETCHFPYPALDHTETLLYLILLQLHAAGQNRAVPLPFLW